VRANRQRSLNSAFCRFGRWFFPRETEHDSHRFERGHSQEVARLVTYFNAKFAGENAPAF